MTDPTPTPDTTAAPAAADRRPRRRTKALVAGAVLGVAALTIGGVAAATGGDDRDDAPLTGVDLDRASEAAIAEAGGGTVTESSTDDDGGPTAYELEVTKDDGTQVDVDLDADFGVVRSETDGPDRDDRDDRDARDDRNDRDGRDGRDDDAPLTGTVLEQASKAAIAEAGGGTVTDTSTDDDGEPTTYEVEVTLADGTQVDVDLDAGFQVLRTDVDRPGDDD